ncbi:MAG: transporter substrate-binding domain-containing protein [Rhodospirillaceae bacterium]|nr:transporter substrate-binding domain-containing protein [Rhodospirillaceae bacterium]
MLASRGRGRAARVGTDRVAEQTSEPWRVGILFSRSGITKVTETEHFFGTTLAIEEINAAGGVAGREIEPVAYDPASDHRRFSHFAERLLTEDAVSTIFGCSTSFSRKAVLPSIERRNGLLWYPSLYEGFEYSPNVIYTGAAPNQNSVQLADYVFETYGSRIYLIGSDYIYPRESNRIMRDLLDARGGTAVAERYLDLHAADDAILDAIADIQTLRPDVVFSTVVGRSAQRLYRLYADAGLRADHIPIASLTMGEGEIRAIGPEATVGHITSSPYFSTVDTQENHGFVARFRRRFGPDAPVSQYAEAAYYQVYLFARALEAAGTLNPQKLCAEALGMEAAAPQGLVTIDPDNNHTYVTPRIGRVEADGTFMIVSEAAAPLKPDPYLIHHWRSEEVMLPVGAD